MSTCVTRGNKANSFVNNFNDGFPNQLTERDELIYKKFWERKMCHVFYKIKMSTVIKYTTICDRQNILKVPYHTTESGMLDRLS
jgi:hypothetical protein